MTAVDGKQGLDIYSANPDSIDLVLLDLIMPKLSGQMVLQEMLKIDPEVKVIICSGHFEEYSEEGILSQAKDFIEKPYRPTKLLKRIRTVLDSKSK